MRLIIISNRLPVTVEKKDKDFILKESVGGLVSGISAYLTSLKNTSDKHAEYIWFGWPGISINKDEQAKLKEKGKELNIHPIFLKENVMEKFYLGFCNKTIWPLFHYFPVYTVYDEEYWDNYKFVNEKFCEEVVSFVQPDDIIWVHDYHLMLLPQLLRKKLPDANIGFFLHIPFPSYEIFRMLPVLWRKELVEGLLGADLIGFHTHDYTKYFINAVIRVLGYEASFGNILTPDRLVRADTFPMGIDYESFAKAVESVEAKNEKNELVKKFHDSKIVLSIDRLDYTKGILNRLKGYEVFLKNNPQWHRKVTMLIIVVPSRIGVDSYSQMKRSIDEKIGSINGSYGNIYWTPIIYQYQYVPFLPLSGIYSVSDIALITPLRDGMNLIAKEYMACRTDKTGVLILSEMAGAAKELGEAVIINPNNTEEIAAAIKDALEMPVEEQVRRNKTMQWRLKRYNVIRWADYFLKALHKVKDTQESFQAKLLDNDEQNEIADKFKSSDKKIVFLDYDGTLVPFAKIPEAAKPVSELTDMLSKLSRCENTTVVIISGRDKETLEEWLGACDTAFAAEHGVWVKEKDRDWKTMANFNTDWKSLVFPIMELYTDLLPGSFIEEKRYSLVWHYRNADIDQANLKAKELLDDLVNFTNNMNLQVLQGSKVIEVKNIGINKGTIVTYFLRKKQYDFIMGIGDDWTDEDMFKALPENAYSIKVGLTASHAKYNLPDYNSVRKLIGDITK
ncbi:MAG: bifunctional alpha,alpha-trehalose-phosphate synthase (UDP-forming)/trehalose-phosphatase [Ignavibacteriae bacterium]|nr:MAG: bifunctional alpha,alpha-trehalose-phosphate synthase (UDP-forming)/trehalose-phosphatase [Ignavibacteriota bacterium]